MRTRDPVKSRARRLKSNYNLTLEQHAQITAHQNGTCAVCLLPPKEGKRLHTDHNHTTGQIRGLLCWRCNKTIGAFRDNVELLRAALEYLQAPPAVAALGRIVYGRPGRITNKRTRKLKSGKIVRKLLAAQIR